MILRMALRELWLARSRLLLLTIVLALQVMTIGGTYVAMHSFVYTRDYFYDTLHFADLEIGFVPAADAELPPLDVLRRIPGVRGVSRRYISRGTIEETEGQPWPVIVVYLDPEPPEVDGIAVLSGRGLDASRPKDAVIDRSFAEERNVKIGDTVVVNPYRFATRFTVTGVGLSPEYLAPAVNPAFSMPAKGSLGIIYASRGQLDAIFLERLYNDLVFVFEPGADPAAVRGRILEALRGLDIEQITPRRSNLGYLLMEQLLKTPRTLSPILAVVVGVLAAIVAYVLMTRIIAGQRREIGALMAMGFPAWHFVLGYALLGGAPGAAGAGVGVFLARAFGRWYAESQARLIGLPPPIVLAPPSILALSAAFAMAVALLGALVPLLGVLRMSPALAMRGGYEIVFRGLPASVERIVAHGRASTRYAVRNVFRRLRLSGAVVLLVSAGIAAPAALLTTNSSWKAWAEQTSARIGWDAMVNFRVPLKRDALAAILSTPGLHEFELFVQARASILRLGAPDHEVRVRGLPVPCRLDRHALTAGRELSSETALEVILNEAMVHEERPLAVGEKVQLATSRGKTFDLTVVGLVNDSSGATALLPLETAQRVLELDGRLSGMFVRYGPMTERAAPPPRLPDAGARPESAEVIDIEDASETAPPPPALHEPKTPETALLREEMVVGLQSRDDAVHTTRQFLSEQREAVFPFLGVGIFLALLATLSVLAILLLDREGEYATLRAMGYGRSGIGRVVFTEVFALSLIGLVGAAFAWIGVAIYIMHALSEILFPLPVTLLLGDLVRVAAPTLAFLAVAAAAGVAVVQRINLREALCTRTIN
jgi:putative ABC transport system permease protein